LAAQTKEKCGGNGLMKGRPERAEPSHQGHS
jgi:hypothetical protein